MPMSSCRRGGAGTRCLTSRSAFSRANSSFNTRLSLKGKQHQIFCQHFSPNSDPTWLKISNFVDFCFSVLAGAKMQKLFFEVLNPLKHGFPEWITVDNLYSYAECHIPQITFHNCRKQSYFTFEGILIVQKWPAMNITLWTENATH